MSNVSGDVTSALSNLEVAANQNTKGESSCQTPVQAHPLAILLDNVSSASNVRAILQTADNARCAIAFCCRTPRPTDADFPQASAGRAAKVPLRHYGSVVDAISAYKAEGYAIWVVGITKKAELHTEPRVPSKVALVIGNDPSQASPSAIDAADKVVYVRRLGLFDGLRVDLATHIVVSDILRRAPWCKWGAQHHKQMDLNVFCEKALALSPTDADAWNHLGNSIGGNMMGMVHSVTVMGKVHSMQECYQKAASLKPYSSSAWSGLTQAYGGTVDGKNYSLKECLENAVGLEPRYAKGWFHIAAHGGGRVDRNPYSKLECFQKALEVEPKGDVSVLSWIGMGQQGGGVLHDGTVDEEEYNCVQCFQKAIALDPWCPKGWSNLGLVGGGHVEGRYVTRKECLENAVELDPERPETRALDELKYMGRIKGNLAVLGGEDSHYGMTDWSIRLFMGSGVIFAGCHLRHGEFTRQEPLLAT